MHAHTASSFDPVDPHHFSELGEHHGHHVTPWQTLLGVLLVLLFFTGLTVFTAQAETYLIREMGWHIPNWVNIAIAMSIATVKALFVIAVFMALKYENPLYTIVFLFCIFAFALFLGLTGLDLDNRGRVYEWKQQSINFGGTGVNVQHPGGTIIDYDGQKIEMKLGGFSGSLAQNLKDAYIKAAGITEEEYWRRWEEANHIHAHDEHLVSTANRTMRRTGLSGALDLSEPTVEHMPPEYAPEKADDHGGH
jgi:cytochrome c oxidase subunit 4